MKQYRVRCERTEVKSNGKNTKTMSNPVNKYGGSIMSIFNSYEDAFNACEKYRAYSAEYEKYCAKMHKQHPDLYPKEVSFDNFRIETRDVSEWTLR